MDLVDILKAGVEFGASDIHLAVGSPPMVRAHGEIHDLPGFPNLDQASSKSLVYSSLFEAQVAEFEAKHELDCSINVTGLARFRVNALMQRGLVEGVYRIIPASIPSPEQLGLGSISMSFADQPRGLVLVTGPTGSGKSTTLACMIERINKTSRRHVLTIEDPIEFVYKKKRSIIRQREVGRDTSTFQIALRQALRQDPDVIMIGEMRDLETMSLALTAAETGHLCFATLHTATAAQSIDRIVDAFPPTQQQQVRAQLGSSLKGVISQILLPRKDAKRMIAAREIMIVNSAIANLIREGKTHMIENVIETSGRQGMLTMDRCLKEMASRGVIDMREALAKAQDLGNFAPEAAVEDTPRRAGQRPVSLEALA